ncbi:hypothetical protein NBO_482g0003 [Nosema bombycis CQ1]|uniref:Uncharacterized protein n=1 Tax=Nosema bombycis (strain CQ1 / CVCC 102059) TaxID=578461 RepID=R0M2K2_NOSB1|nr:hypothetical protein NBO_482g0003 [Nosema bombycis CQ1]|eukprot:EOB12264.1 hypothetical protein NBO_482g0003 [Nosema bombycis CQ1]
MQDIYFIFLINIIEASIERLSEERSVSETNPIMFDSAHKYSRINMSQDQEEKKSYIQSFYTPQEDSQSNVVIELQNIAEADKPENSFLLKKKKVSKINATKSIDNQGLLWKILVWYNGLLLLFLLVLLIFAIFTVVYILLGKEDYLIGTLVMGFILSIGILALYLGWNIEKTAKGK